MEHMQICWLDCLADLNQENPFVAETLLTWIKDLVTTYAIDGLRIDTIPFVTKDFWIDFTEAAGVFALGEVFDSRVFFVGGY